MTRRALLIFAIAQARLGILALRVVVGRPLPRWWMLLLARLDAAALALERKGEQ